jgi:hypothetical protein
MTKNKTSIKTSIAKIVRDNAAQYKLVLVQFPRGGKLYSYYAKASWDISIGDTVTVNTPHAEDVKVEVQGLMPLNEWLANGGTMPTSQITGKEAFYEFPEIELPLAAQLNN